MRIRSIRVCNYKSFRDTGDLAFGAGINVITGQNNAGKTALLEALRLNFQARPHRSVETVPRPTVAPQPTSSAVIRFDVEQEELADILGNTLTTFGAFPNGAYPGEPAARAEQTLRFIEEARQLSFECEYISGDSRGQGFIFTRRPTYDTYEIDDNRQEAPIYTFTREPGRPYRYTRTVHGFGVNTGRGSDELGLAMAEVLRDRTYLFKAERLNLGHARFGPSRDLLPDAANLAEVLMGLAAANRDRFDRYNRLVHRILPQVERVSANALPGDRVEIRVWSDGTPREREDLTVSLAESGTGIGQVLALLYVVVTAEFPRVIVIDEPNTFLHPGAARALVEVLREHPMHQFIISTHSPGVVAAAEPAVIHLIKREAGVSVVEQINTADAAEVRQYLREIGVSLAEVFGADKILWVEGDTEEDCFPLIVHRLLGQPLAGIAILAVDTTGELMGRGAEATYGLYRRLSEGPGLIPPAIGFIFDREGRTATEVEDLLRRGRGRVAFLERRTYENYLLFDDAITEVLNGLPEMAGVPVTLEAVTKWLDEHGGERQYGCGVDRTAHRDRWVAEVDAPKLLADLFQQVTEARQFYSKRRDSRALTEWLLQHRPEALQPIATLLATRLALPEG
jgi:predicted ATPase